VNEQDFFYLFKNNWNSSNRCFGTHFAVHITAVSVDSIKTEKANTTVIKIISMALLFSVLILSICALWLAVKELMSE